MTVVVVGLDGSNEGEGHDRQNITLLGAQLELVQALHAAVGVQRLVVVLVNGGQLSVDWIKRNCPTVIEALEGGQSGGVALAEIISGVVAPSGVELRRRSPLLTCCAPRWPMPGPRAAPVAAQQ